MPRVAQLVAALVLVALAGCVAVTTPTEPPTPTPMPVLTVPPVNASQSAIPPPTALPGGSVQPSGTPAASSPVGLPGASLSIEDFGATTPLFTDGFDDPLSGWGTGSTSGGDVAYADSALEFQTGADGTWVWSYRPLVSVQNVVHLEAALTPSADGYQGLLCAHSEELLYGAVVSAEGRWVFVTLTAEGATVLTTAPDVGWTLAPAVPTRLALDCAGTITGAFRMQMSLPELGRVVRYEGGSTGPDAFDRVGIYAEASSAEYMLRADDFAAFGGSGSGP